MDAVIRCIALCTVLVVLLAGVQCQKKQPHKKVDIYSLHIRSDIQFRFATTTVTSRVANRNYKAREVTFRVTLPKAAFLSQFSMEIDGKVYPGDVKEKQKAKSQYDRAVSRGQSAGYVGTKARDSNKFDVSVNVGAQKKVKFTLIYQELLTRRLNNYEHLINIDPGQVVKDMRIQVAINESREITSLSVPPLRKNYENSVDPVKGNHDTAMVNRTSPHSAFIAYAPTPEEQEEASENGLRGQFVVKYDVQRSLDAGEVKVGDGYFVHYFAPTNLSPVNKNVIFIIDISGSMSGKKMTQTKDAMLQILRDLRPGDNFNLLTFSTRVHYWKKERLVPVNSETLAEAKEFVKSMRAHGGTNINDAVLQGLRFLKRQDEIGESSLASMLIFLTDGEPTSGETSVSKIMENIRKSNKGEYSLYSLGFGFGADFGFLQKLSLQNRGLARKIYEDSDANLQLEGFYKEISTPLLSDIKITYLDSVVDKDSLTENKFHCFFDGTEIIIAGKLKTSNISHFRSEITGKSSKGEIRLKMDEELYPPVIRHQPRMEHRSNFTKFTERLWAYLTIKELLRKAMESSNDTAKEEFNQRALRMSLKYSFVTPLTSMVVTKPDQDEGAASNLEDTDEQAPGLDAVGFYPSSLTNSQSAPQYSIAHAVGLSAPLMHAVHSPSRARGILHVPSFKKYRTQRKGTKQKMKKRKYTTTAPSTTSTTMAPTTVKPGSSKHYVYMKLKASTSSSQRLPLCVHIEQVAAGTYEFLHDNTTGLTINIKIKDLDDVAYISEVFISMPRSKDVHMTSRAIKVGNTTIKYKRRTTSLGHGKMLVRNDRQIRLRYRSRHFIRIQRRVVKSSTNGNRVEFTVSTVKGVQPKSTGIQGYLWHASGNVKRQMGASKPKHILSLNIPHQSNISCPANYAKNITDVNTGSLVSCFTAPCLTQRVSSFMIRDIYG